MILEDIKSEIKYKLSYIAVSQSVRSGQVRPSETRMNNHARLTEFSVAVAKLFFIGII